MTEPSELADVAAPIDGDHLREIERLLALRGRYHRRIQFTNWEMTTPEHLADCFAHALRESATANPNARFWWVETGDVESPLIVGYLGNGPSSELNAWLLGAGPSLVARIRASEAEVERLRGELESLKRFAERRLTELQGVIRERDEARTENVRQFQQFERTQECSRSLVDQRDRLHVENAALRAALEPLEKIARRRAGNVRDTNTLSSDVAADHWLALADTARAALGAVRVKP
jgi:hypothetical protein